MSFHFISCHLTLRHIMSYHRISLIKFKIASYLFVISLCLMSSLIHLYHVMSSQFTSWYLTSPFVCLHVESCHPTSPNVILFRHVVTPSHLISSHLNSAHVCSSVIVRNYAFSFFEGTYPIFHCHTPFKAQFSLASDETRYIPYYCYK